MVEKERGEFAVKVFKKRAIDSVAKIESIATEAKVLRDISPHPNIVALIDVVVGSESIYLVMEKAALDLFQYVDTLFPARVQPRSVKEVAIAVTTALDFMHSKGISHMDIK